MARQTTSAAIRTIGIDTGKNTLHMIGLDQRGAIVLREKVRQELRASDTSTSGPFAERTPRALTLGPL
jgi:hypothetical protein